MTGYGQAVAETPQVRVTIEVRSVNNRFADMKLRLPDVLVPFEPELRRAVLAKVKRGRVEIDLRVEPVGSSGEPVTLNHDTVKAVLAAWKTLRDEFGVPGDGDLATLMRVPGVLEVAEGARELDEAGHAAVRTALDRALDALNVARAREGALLVADLVARLDRMAEVLADVRSRAALVPELLRQKLLDRIEQLAAGVSIDATLLAQEVAFIADRADVTEEIVRLEGHLAQGRGFMSKPDG